MFPIPHIIRFTWTHHAIHTLRTHCAHATQTRTQNLTMHIHRAHATQTHTHTHKTHNTFTAQTKHCQMQLYFVARLEPTRTRWKDGSVHMTSLETREASVQEGNGVKSVCNSTLTPQLGLALRPN